MKVVYINWHILKVNKRSNEPFEFKKLNKITRNVKLFMKVYFKGESKKLLIIIKKRRDPK